MPKAAWSCDKQWKNKKKVLKTKKTWEDIPALLMEDILIYLKGFFKDESLPLLLLEIQTCGQRVCSL